MVSRRKLRTVLTTLGLYAGCALVIALFRGQRLQRQPRPAGPAGPRPAVRGAQRGTRPLKKERAEWEHRVKLLRSGEHRSRHAGGAGAREPELSRPARTDLDAQAAVRSLRRSLAPRQISFAIRRLDAGGLPCARGCHALSPRPKLSYWMKAVGRRSLARGDTWPSPELGAACRCAPDKRSGQRAGAGHNAAARRSHQGPGARRLPRHAADPPLRGEGGPDVRHGPDRRLLPSLHRPGGRRRRHADGAQGGRRRHHRLSRPRPHAGLRHGPQGRDGRAHRTQPRLFRAARAARCTCSPPRRASSAATASSARRCRSAPASPSPTKYRGNDNVSPDLFRRRRRQPGPGLRELQHGEALEAAGRSTSSRTTSTPWAPRSSAPRPRPTCRSAARPIDIPGEQVDGMDVRAVKAAGRQGRAMVPRGQRPDHSRDADLPLSRPLDVGPGEVPHPRGGREGAHRARSDRAGAPARACRRNGRARTTSRRSTPRCARSSTRPPSSPPTIPSPIRPSSTPTSTPECAY